MVSNQGFGDEAGKPRNPKLLAESTGVDLHIGFPQSFSSTLFQWLRFRNKNISPCFYGSPLTVAKSLLPGTTEAPGL